MPPKRWNIKKKSSKKNRFLKFEMAFFKKLKMLQKIACENNMGNCISNIQPQTKPLPLLLSNKTHPSLCLQISK